MSKKQDGKKQKRNKHIKNIKKGGQTAHDQEVVGSNTGTVYWMDVSDASYYIQENNKNKGSRMGHTKKIFKKKKGGQIKEGKKTR